MNLWKKIKALFTRKKLESKPETTKFMDSKVVVKLTIPNNEDLFQYKRALQIVKIKNMERKYTEKKIRGMPPKSARNKKMWHSATKEELEEEQ